jgi:hypothetical protein
MESAGSKNKDARRCVRSFARSRSELRQGWPSLAEATMDAAGNSQGSWGRSPGVPPLERLLVEVTIPERCNRVQVGASPDESPRTLGSIDKLEQLAASSGATSIAIGRFLGPGGRYAILLAPAAQVTLRNLEVRWLREQGVKGGRIRYRVRGRGDAGCGVDGAVVRPGSDGIRRRRDGHAVGASRSEPSSARLTRRSR